MTPDEIRTLPMGEWIFLKTRNPVSYTHLDVYKRQAYWFMKASEKNIPAGQYALAQYLESGSIPLLGKDIEAAERLYEKAAAAGYRPVSYTHLLGEQQRLCGKDFKLWPGFHSAAGFGAGKQHHYRHTWGQQQY